MVIITVQAIGRKEGFFIMTEEKKNAVNNLHGDIWTGDDDVLLAETVLRFVREGKTVMDACREMESLTEGRRTASASKFRWFTKLVDQYQGGYEIAKQEGKKAKEAKKRKVNKGERFEEIFESVLNKSDEIEKQIDPDDFIVLAKKFKEQQNKKKQEVSSHEKEMKQLRRDNEKLGKELEEAKKEVELYNELLLAKQKDYNKVIEALQTLKGLGVNISIPEPESPKYVVDKDGIVSKKD